MNSFLSYIIISASVIYAFAYPFWSEVSVKIEEKSKYEAVIEQVNSLNQKKDEILAKIDQISPEVQQNINTFMPNKLDFVKLTSDINSVGSKYGITVDKVNSVEKDKSVGDSISEAAPPRVYSSAAVSFSFTASYANYVKFIQDIEKSLRILDIKSASINPKEGGLYDFNVEMETYWAE